MGAASNTRVVAHDPPLSIRIRRVIDWIASHLEGVGYRSHFVVTALLAAAFVPALFVSRLPVKLDWAVLLNTYWIGFAFQAMFFATLLYVIQFPAKDTIGPLWSRCQHDKRRLLVLVPLLLFLFWFYVHFRFVVLFPLFAVVALAIVELVERTRTKVGAFTRAVSSVLLPAAYLFLGLILVSGYNDIAVASRPYVSYDAVFARVDSWILMGASVPGIVHHALRLLPLGLFKFLEFVYIFAMFPQVGAALILTGFCYGRSHAFRFVGAILTAYYLALAFFFFWPSQGPYYLCAAHFSEFPSSLQTFSLQKRQLLQASSLWAGKGIESVGLDYYVAFPSLHIAMPLVVAWFLRRWK